MIQTDLSGKTAVVTGGGGILCSAMASALARSGAQVAVLDLREEAATRVAKEIVDQGRPGPGLCLQRAGKGQPGENQRPDRSRLRSGRSSWSTGRAATIPRGPPPRSICAPKISRIPPTTNWITFYDLELEGIQFVFNLNLLGTLLPSQAFTRSMAARKAGVVINISSMNAFTPLTKIPAYSGAKAAVSNFTRWLAVHMSKVGIRVNAIAPGFFATSQNHQLLFQRRLTASRRAARPSSPRPQWAGLVTRRTWREPCSGSRTTSPRRS